LAKLALEGEWHAIDQDEKLFGPIPDDIKASLNIARNPEESASSLKKDIQVALWGTGAPFREFLHVNDLAAAALFIMRIDDGVYKRALKEGGNAQNSKTPENSNNVFINIGTGKDITIKELAELVAEVVGYKGQIKWDPSKPDGTPRKLMNTNVISSLGWQPKISLKTGIELTYQDYLSKYSYS
jgi:GDP-L-fucose synthase